MSQVISKAAAARQQMLNMFEPVQKEMAQVEEMLRSELRSDHAFVNELAQHGFRIGGKRLRPALVLLSAQAVGEISQDHITLATVVEMIHTATLVHDDVLDEAELRRHIDTVNARYSNEASVLLGDYLFTHSFYLASTLESTFACRTIGRATNIVCEGELRQVASSGNFQLSEAEYLEIIDGKTAELCACCCQLGAHYAGADASTVEKLAAFGRQLGIAFQIADDLLDVLGDEQVTGKSLGTDLKKRKSTLPIIRVLQLASPAERAEIEELLAEAASQTCGALTPWLEKFEAIDYARSRAKSFAGAARAQLDDLPESDAVSILRGLTEFVVAREQ